MSDNEQVDIFKKIMGKYPTGVTIVTTLDGSSTPAGLTVNSFTSVSLEPPMILWCIDKRFSSFSSFLQAKKFAVHILSAEQENACWAFAGKDPDRFTKVKWEISDNGLPIISDSLGILECKTVQQIDAGDHMILLGEVTGLVAEDKEPLMYYSRKIGTIPEHWPDGPGNS